MNENEYLDLVRKTAENSSDPFVRKITASKIKRRLRSIIKGDKISSKELQTLASFHGIPISSVEDQLIDRDNLVDELILALRSDIKNYKAMARFISGEVQKPSSVATVDVAAILLGISFKKKSDEVTTLRDKLAYYYRNKSEFNAIKINGDVENLIGELSMDRFYVRLSYLEQKDVKSKNSLIRMEGENSWFRIKKSEHIVKDLSQDYLSIKSIGNISKIIISGNPGVGKSTFAKWFCYNWSTSEEFKSKIPIYISLRKVRFSEKYPINDYVKRYYSELSAIFTGIDKDQIVFILDGFDEISENDKQILTEEIESFNFILLSRPFGLIHHHLKYEACFHIEGFNKSCVKSYIETIFELKKTSFNRIEKFTRIISRNPVLSDYSSNPLMLSQMALIFLSEENSEMKLTEINSSYELQSSVYEWIWHYYQKKSLKDKVNELDILNFAYEMHRNQNFILRLGYNEQAKYDVARAISVLGLGSITEEKHKWSFSFNSVTFQEFLFAKKFSKQEGKNEKLAYLCKYPFYWDSIKLIVGLFSSESNTSIINEILSFFKNKSGSESNFYEHVYWMLLAETNSSTITSELNESAFEKAIEIYRQNYFNDFWRGVNYNSISQIIAKTVATNKNKADFLLAEISANIDQHKPGQTSDNVDGELFYVSDLIEIGLKYNGELLIDKLISTIHILIEKIDYLDDESNQTLNLLNSVYNLASDFELFPLDILVMRKNRIEELHDALRETAIGGQFFYQYIARLNSVSRYTEVINARNKFNELINQKDALFTNKIELLKSYIEFICQGLSSNFLDLEAKETVNEYVEETTLWFLNNVEFESGDVIDFDYHYILDVLVTNLILTQNPEYIPLLGIAIHQFDVQPLIEIQSQQSFIDYINNVLIDSIFDKTRAKIPVIISLIKGLNCKFYYYYFQDNIYKLFMTLIKEGNDAVNHNLLTSLLDIPETSQDKKSFLQFIIDNKLAESNPFVREIVFKHILNDLVFYERRYWDYLFAFLSKDDDSIELILPLTVNNELYAFDDNLPFLAHLLKRSINVARKMKTLGQKNVDFLKSVSYLMLKMVRTNIIFSPQFIDDIRIALTGKELIDFYQNTWGLDTLDCFLAYVLFPFYYDKGSLILPSKLDEIREAIIEEPAGVEVLLEYVMEFTDAHADLTYATVLHKIEPIVGAKIALSFEKIFADRLLDLEKYSPAEI